MSELNDKVNFIRMYQKLVVIQELLDCVTDEDLEAIYHRASPKMTSSYEEALLISALNTVKLMRDKWIVVKDLPWLSTT